MNTTTTYRRKATRTYSHPLRQYPISNLVRYQKKSERLGVEFGGEIDEKQRIKTVAKGDMAYQLHVPNTGEQVEWHTHPLDNVLKPSSKDMAEFIANKNRKVMILTGRKAIGILRKTDKTPKLTYQEVMDLPWKHPTGLTPEEVGLDYKVFPIS